MKIIFLIFAVLFISSTTQAQIFRGYGLKVGTTISNQEWEYSKESGLSHASFNSDNRLGINIGLFADILDIPFVSIVTEVNYIQKGMKKEIPITTSSQPDGTGEFITWDTRLDYINLSALVKVRLNYGIFTPYLLFGPKIDFEINKKNSLDPNNILEENYNKNRFGLKVGLGTEINLISFNLLAEFLYDIDLNELYKNDILKINSNSFGLRVGLMF